jgi:hypothetical protein
MLVANAGVWFLVAAVLPQDTKFIRSLGLCGIAFLVYITSSYFDMIAKTFDCGWSHCADAIVMGWIAMLSNVILIVLTFRTYFYPARKALTMIWRIIGWKMFASAFLVMVPDVMQRLGYGASVPIDRPLWEKLIGAGSCIIFGSIYHTTRIRERFHAFLSQHGHEVNVAMLLAGFLGGNVDEEAVRKDSVRLFRYVHLSELAFTDMLDATSGARSQEVFLRSQPALLGEIDAFVSHSWHDDPKAKWDALQAWCKGFYEKFGRQPKLWLDFCCIDQNNIEANLRCLPVWLSACHQILIIAGPTYVQRLWCAIELFVFVSIHDSRTEPRR